MKMSKEHYKALSMEFYTVFNTMLKKDVVRAKHQNEPTQTGWNIYHFIYDNKVLGENHPRWQNSPRQLPYDPDFRYRYGEYTDDHLNTAISKIMNEMVNRKSVIVKVTKIDYGRVIQMLRTTASVLDAAPRKNEMVNGVEMAVITCDITKTIGAFMEQIQARFPRVDYLFVDHDPDGDYSWMPSNPELIKEESDEYAK